VLNSKLKNKTSGSSAAKELNTNTTILKYAIHFSQFAEQSIIFSVISYKRQNKIV
jgi:hypothetical protein